MASREFHALLDALSTPMIDPSDSLEVARDKLNALHGHPIAQDTDVEWVTLAGVACAWVVPAEARDSDRILLLCHGGAWIAAGGDGYLFYAEMLGAACRAKVLLVDYRLAPEHHHPAPIEDCAAAYRGLLEAGHAASQIGFIGDSCGGGLAISTLIQLRDEELPLPAMGIALGGWFDLEATGESALEPMGHEPFADPEFTRARARDYLGPNGDPTDPLASPIYADLRGLPPLLLQVGQVDLTRDDAVRLAARAGRDGVAVQLEIHPEMFHGFQGLARAGLPEAKYALEQVCEFVASRMRR